MGGWKIKEEIDEKMIWKEFLKPNWKKALLAVILSIILGAIAFYFGRQYQDPWPNWPPGEPKPPGGLFRFKLNPLLWLPAPLVSRKHSYVETCSVDLNKILLVTIPYWIIVSYFFSCAIIWMRGKMREQ